MVNTKLAARGQRPTEWIFMSPTTRHRGSSGEYTAAAYFAVNGWDIFWSPNGSGPVDFIASKPDTTQRVQVKTASIWKQGSRRYTRAMTKKSNGDKYSENDYDVLAAVAADGRMWVIPYKNLPDTKSLYLHLDDGEGGNVYDTMDAFMVSQHAQS